jgi:hypothetical protein
VWVPETRLSVRGDIGSVSRVVAGLCWARRNRSLSWWGRARGSGSGCLAVLVDESAAGEVSSDRLAGPVRDGCGAVGRALAECSVGPVRVVVLDVFAQELFQLPTVPDEGAVEELATHGADPAFRVSVRDWGMWWCADDRRAGLRKISSKAATNWPAPSRIRNRMSREQFIMRFRAAWVVQCPLGLAVMPARWTRLVWSSMKNSTE